LTAEPAAVTSPMSSSTPAGEHTGRTVRVLDMMLSATDANARDRVAKRRLDALQANLERLELLDDISTSFSTPLGPRDDRPARSV
jgi:hypothetical protein